LNQRKVVMKQQQQRRCDDQGKEGFGFPESRMKNFNKIGRL